MNSGKEIWMLPLIYVCHYDVGIEALPSPILNITTTTTTYEAGKVCK